VSGTLSRSSAPEHSTTTATIPGTSPNLQSKDAIQRGGGRDIAHAHVHIHANGKEGWASSHQTSRYNLDILDSPTSEPMIQITGAACACSALSGGGKERNKPIRKNRWFIDLCLHPLMYIAYMHILLHVHLMYMSVLCTMKDAWKWRSSVPDLFG
jgi:hypothetical protein